jgi:hypothetical protein
MATVVKIGALVAVLAVILFGLGTAVTFAFDQYGFHPERNARAWAIRTPEYGEAATCRECHAGEYRAWSLARHAAVVCESCHGPMAAHASDGTAATAELPKLTGDICIACHEKVEGRPPSVPQVDLATHHGTTSCVLCHDPHAATAVLPPTVTHPLANLPACTVCHGREGLNPMPLGHTESSDSICLGCHTPGGSSP